MAHVATALFECSWEIDIDGGAVNHRLRDFASSFAEFARELEEAGGANPQANALLARVLNLPRGAYGTVFTNRPDLPDGYVLFEEHHTPGHTTFECGIAPDGSVSS